MAQASDNVREAAAFARRMACRALAVVGGAVAGTALAWVLSSTLASAESVDASGPEVQVVSELVDPVSDTLAGVAGRLSPSEDSLKEFGNRVKEAADRFGERAAEGIEQLPTCDMSGCGLGLDEIGEIGEIGAPGSYLPGDGFGRSDVPQTPPGVVPVAGGNLDLGVTPDFLAESTATGRANADGMNRRGSPAQELPSLPTLPDFPAWPAPAAPTTAPGGQGHSGNHVDGALSAALPWHDGFTALTAGQTLPATEVISFGRAGAQPGVTPD